MKLVGLAVNHSRGTELVLGYAGTLDGAPGPLYSDYVQYIHSRLARADAEYWVRYLGGL